MKLQQQGTTKHILVPAPKSNFIPSSTDITNTKVQTRVDNPEDIFNILLQQKFSQLLKSQNAITSKGNLLESIGWNTEGDLVDDLLQGINETRASTIAEGDKILANFLQAMKYAVTEDGKRIEKFNWTYGVEEYKATFSKTRESTACGPSGLHMSHWKAALEREEIMRVHPFLCGLHFSLNLPTQDGKFPGIVC